MVALRVHCVKGTPSAQRFCTVLFNSKLEEEGLPTTSVIVSVTEIEVQKGVLDLDIAQGIDCIGGGFVRCVSN